MNSLTALSSALMSGPYSSVVWTFFFLPLLSCVLISSSSISKGDNFYRFLLEIGDSSNWITVASPDSYPKNVDASAGVFLEDWTFEALLLSAVGCKKLFSPASYIMLHRSLGLRRLCLSKNWYLLVYCRVSSWFGSVPISSWSRFCIDALSSFFLGESSGDSWNDERTSACYTFSSLSCANGLRQAGTRPYSLGFCRLKS